jgi:hypothetical protein
VQHADTWQLNPLSLGGYTHERLMLSAHNHVTGHQPIPLFQKFLNSHRCIREYFPEGIVELLHILQSRLYSLISMQDYVVRIEIEIFLPLVRISEILDCLFEDLSI